VGIRTIARKFSIGGLCVSAGGLDTPKIDKISTDDSVSCLNLPGLGALFGGLRPKRPPWSRDWWEYWETMCCSCKTKEHQQEQENQITKITNKQQNN